MPKLLSVAEMLAVEKAADAAGLSYDQMMVNAGHSLAKSLIAHSQNRGNSVFSLVGSGNNGGDALLALTDLADKGWQVSAYLLGRKKDEKYVSQVKNAGANIIESQSGLNWAQVLVDQAFLLDGLLGTGITLPLRKPDAELLKEVGLALDTMANPPFIVAVDCPSGMDCETGELAAETINVDLTVSMAAVKRGMLTLPAFQYLGALEVGDIGLPDDLPEWASLYRTIVDEDMVRAALPNRPLDAHKGTFGTALIIAGSRSYPGAALLAGRAAARSGVGLVTMAVPEGIQTALAGHLPEATWQLLPEEKGWIAADAVSEVQASMGKAKAVLLGPGFGIQKTTGHLLENFLKLNTPFLVIDADGLKLLAQIKDWPGRLPPESILTPHPGEMAILSGLTVEDIQADRIDLTERFAEEWNQVLVLKGAFTVIAAPDGRSAVLPLATPALATAGTGDVLAGLITGLRAQGVPAFEASCAAVWLHARAGLRAAERLGSTAGVLAGDLVKELPVLLNN